MALLEGTDKHPELRGGVCETVKCMCVTANAKYLLLPDKHTQQQI